MSQSFRAGPVGSMHSHWEGHIIDAVLVALAALAIVYFGVSYLRRGAAADARTVMERVEAGLVGRTLDRAPEDGRGRPSLVMLFTTTCEFCEQTAPAWRKLTDAVGEMAQVTLATPERREVAEPWVAQHGLFADSLVTDISMDSWGAAGVPVTFLTDSKRVVRHARTGVVNDDDVRAMRLVAEALPPDSLSVIRPRSSP